MVQSIVNEFSLREFITKRKDWNIFTNYLALWTVSISFGLEAGHKKVTANKVNASWRKEAEGEWGRGRNTDGLVQKNRESLA